MAPIFTGSKFGFGRSAEGAAPGVSLEDLEPDAFGSYLVLAMPLNGNYNDYAYLYNGGVTESSRTWTANTGTGGVIEFQTSQYKFYNNAFRSYNGTGGAYATTTNLTSTDFEFAGDFCIEAWVYIDTGASDTGICGSAKDPSLPNSFNLSAGIAVRGAGSGLTSALQGSCLGDPYRGDFAWGYGGWHHFAMGRTGSTLYYWYDGGGAGSVTLTGTYPQAVCQGANYLLLGGTNTYATNKNVYINDIRFYKGINKYTTSFTPPSKMFIG
jgi:hypothetical protein